MLAKRFLQLFVSLLLLFSCSKEEIPAEEFWDFGDFDETPPVLTHVPTDLETIWAVIPFGAFLPAVLNPTFEYYSDNPQANVYAACNGIVTKITLNSHFNDYSITIKTKLNSSWSIIYDHVLSPLITINASVQAGSILGKIGTGNRVELQVNRAIFRESEISVCPLSLSNGQFASAHEDLRTRLKAANGYDFLWCIKTVVSP
jgi:hypothetical protein